MIALGGFIRRGPSCLVRPATHNLSQAGRPVGVGVANDGASARVKSGLGYPLRSSDQAESMGRILPDSSTGILKPRSESSERQPLILTIALDLARRSGGDW